MGVSKSEGLRSEELIVVADVEKKERERSERRSPAARVRQRRWGDGILGNK